MNATIERIYQVLGNSVLTYNLQEAYVDDADQRVGILAAEVFAIISTCRHTLKKNLVKLIFC